MLDRQEQVARNQVDALRERHPWVATIVRRGSPRQVILDVADEIAADLIVMGTHGRSGFKRWVLGSVAEHVVRNSQIPVMVVRQTADDAAPTG